MRIEEFLLQVAKDWAADKMEALEPESAQTQCTQDHQLKPHVGLMGSPLGDFRVICGNMCLRKS
jgi:hypothetical protein